MQQSIDGQLSCLRQDSVVLELDLTEVVQHPTSLEEKKTEKTSEI